MRHHIHWSVTRNTMEALDQLPANTKQQFLSQHTQFSIKITAKLDKDVGFKFKEEEGTDNSLLIW